jgi:hypothetical protein
MNTKQTTCGLADYFLPLPERENEVNTKLITEN